MSKVAQTSVAIKTESEIIRYSLFGGFTAALLAWAYFMFTNTWTVKIIGPVSSGRVGLTISVLFGSIGFGLLFWRIESAKFADGERNISKQWVRWRDTITLSLAYSVTYSAVMGLLVWALNESFVGLELDPYISSALIGVSIGVYLYLLLGRAVVVTAEALTMLLSQVLIGGVFLAMFTQSEPDWWQVHFSFLGMSGSTSFLAFNLTLIFSGLLMLALTEHVFANLTHVVKSDPLLKKETKIQTVKASFVIIAFALAGVGLFPYVHDSILATLHNLSAFTLVIVFLGLIAGLKRLIPVLSGEFLSISYIVATALIASFFLKSVGYFNLTAFELIAFALCFIWLSLFLRTVNLIGREKVAHEQLFWANKK